MEANEPPIRIIVPGRTYRLIMTRPIRQCFTNVKGW